MLAYTLNTGYIIVLWSYTDDNRCYGVNKLQIFTRHMWFIALQLVLSSIIIINVCHEQTFNLKNNRKTLIPRYINLLMFDIYSIDPWSCCMQRIRDFRVILCCYTNKSHLELCSLSQQQKILCHSQSVCGVKIYF